MPNKQRIDDLKGYIEFMAQSLERLEKRYQGVRPSWVSADLAVDGASLARARKELAELMNSEEDKVEKCFICDTPTPDGGIEGCCHSCWEYDRTLPPHPTTDNQKGLEADNET